MGCEERPLGLNAFRRMVVDLVNGLPNAFREMFEILTVASRGH